MKPALNFRQWMVLLILEINRNMIFMTVSLHTQSFQKAMTRFLAKHCCMGNLSSRSGTQKTSQPCAQCQSIWYVGGRIWKLWSSSSKNANIGKAILSVLTNQAMSTQSTRNFSLSKNVVSEIKTSLSEIKFTIFQGFGPLKIFEPDQAWGPANFFWSIRAGSGPLRPFFNLLRSTKNKMAEF